MNVDSYFFSNLRLHLRGSAYAKTRLSKLKMLGANLDFLGANRVFARRIAPCTKHGVVGPGVGVMMLFLTVAYQNHI